MQVRSTGVRSNFSRGANSIFCLSFPCCWRCNANARSQNALPFLHHNENAPCYAGAWRGGAKGAQFPGPRINKGALNHCGGRHKSQQCHRYFLQYSAFASERSQVRTWGGQTCLLPRAPSNLVKPLLLRQQSQKSRFVGAAMLIFHSCVFSHCTVQNYEAYHY